MELTDYIGCEVSIPSGEGRTRLRGYVAEITSGGKLLVAVYPAGDDSLHDEHQVEPEQLRLLKAGVLAGWRALDIRHPDNSPYVSLRVRPSTIDVLKQIAREDKISLDEAFSKILHEQIERLTARAAALTSAA